MKFTKNEQELLNSILSNYECFYTNVKDECELIQDINYDPKEYKKESKALEGLQSKLVK